MKHKERLDLLLVEKGLCDSRSRAQSVIMSGEVYVNGQKSDKAGTLTDVEANIEVRGSACPYVSRGGLKLEKALRDFGVSPAGLTCLYGRLYGLPPAKRRSEGLCHRCRLRPAGLEHPDRPARCVHGAHEHSLCHPGAAW